VEFKDKDAIYLQIAAYVSENILLGKWLPDEKIPSTLDLAVELEVNPNTVIRSYEFLQNQEVVVNRRGWVYLLLPTALKRLRLIARNASSNSNYRNFSETYTCWTLILMTCRPCIKTISKTPIKQLKTNENEFQIIYCCPAFLSAVYNYL
jgi:DNA-binding transcriptional regulator YhcF (GntR family)